MNVLCEDVSSVYAWVKRYDLIKYLTDGQPQPQLPRPERLPRNHLGKNGKPGRPTKPETLARRAGKGSEE